MKIHELEFFLVEAPSADEDLPARSLLARVASESGAEGWGEAGAHWRTTELAARRDTVLSVVAGRSVFNVEELTRLDVLRDPRICCAVEMACWDLIGRAAGQPLCRLFGGPYRERVPLAVGLPCRQDANLGHLARELAEQGFHALVVPVCGEDKADLVRMAEVREGAGGQIELRLDGEGRYALERARGICGELEGDPPRFFLDPVAEDDLHAMTSLGRQTSVPLAAGRSIHGPADVLAAVRSGAAAFVVVDLERVGGISAARKCAAVAEAGSLGAVLGGGASLGPAVAAMLQLAASTPAFSSGNQCPYHRSLGELLVEPLEIIDGMISVAQGPGLGVEVDRAKVERYQVG